MPRPAPRFHDFVGHKSVVDYLRRQLAGAQARTEPFPHALFAGPSGVGKTRLSRALAAEYGTRLVEAMGCDDRDAFAQKLAGMSACDFLFVDESHRLRPLDQELLCATIDRNSLPNLARLRGEQGEEKVALKPWTLVLATDQPGLLLDALLKRISIVVPLTYYPQAELKEIAEAMASELNVLLSPQAARLIAEVAGGLPRKAKQLLTNLRLFHSQAEDRQLGLAEVREFLDASGVDEAGLGPSERSYLGVVADLGGASLETVALSLGVDADYVRRQVEPDLVRRRLVKIASSGRQLTPLGRQAVQLSRGTSQPP